MLDLAKETVERISDVLNVEVIGSGVAGEALVGTYTCLTNHSGLVHSQTSLEELDQLDSLNRGTVLIGSGLVANAWVAFCGLDTTSTALSLVESVFQLTESSTVMHRVYYAMQS
ncbi:Eukaryotic translation initiation factor 6 [Echinococcus granulosus]|uniref:Eukaryotic translation initiation factor 6 n=1 Tax=Echinococcus granulosus TaxID=6210 RepID=W6UWU7_ECHGR|nr:Eukaryotic translation initiation factor 6 [Echinococcus granulosus]EUB62972.1 Eukaryotic translation initiation factor 6 [Echinococcus granulosus]